MRGSALLFWGFSWANEAFTFVVLPDTQYYARSSDGSELFTGQTQWIAEQIQLEGNPRNIQFVSHLGDIVNSGSDLVEWQRADTSMSVLDDVVKYSVLPGNHDYASRSVKDSGTANYLSFFGPQRFANDAWYGADPSGNNSYQRFSAGGYDFIHLALEFQPTVNVPIREPSPVEWAQSIIDANPHTPVIVSTHDYLRDSPPKRSATGEALWNELIRRNDQIFMVLNGHFHNEGGELHRVSVNDAGRPVIEVIQDYQGYENGGDGWLRLIEFDIPENRIEFETYSPVLNQFQTETVDEVGPYASQFGFDIDFADRLEPILLPLIPGDFDDNSMVNGKDFLIWQRGQSPEPLSESDLSDWQSQFNTSQALIVPEPVALVPASIMLVVCLATRSLCSRSQYYS